MYGDLSVDLGAAIPYAVDKVLSLLGKDSTTVANKERVTRHYRLALKEASFVQCVGMPDPVPLESIYQPTRLMLVDHPDNPTHLAPSEIIRSNAATIVFGGPGRGKSVFAHWTYLQLLRQQDVLPILITLRWPGALEDLEFFASSLGKGAIRDSSRTRIVLIVDGYDELDHKDRTQVSHLLRDAEANESARFILTCRSHYEVIDLVARRIHIAGFDETDAFNYCTTYFTFCGFRCDVEDFLNTLRSRGFTDFLSSPLLLALVCVLRTGPMPTLPSTSIGLIRRAIDTLTLRWDEQKGIARTGAITIDGEDRIRALMQIAFETKDLVARETMVLAVLDKYLSRIQRGRINGMSLLREMAQWYGLLVPVADSSWAFAHKSIHDYLAARQWVESGTFSSERVAAYDARSAYAACLIPNATTFIRKSLLASKDITVLMECIHNNAYFDANDVARGLSRHYHKFSSFEYSDDGTTICAKADGDFYRAAGTKLLQELVDFGMRSAKTEDKALYVLALSELHHRSVAPALTMPIDLSNRRCRVTRGGREFDFSLAEAHHPKQKPQSGFPSN